MKFTSAALALGLALLGASTLSAEVGFKPRNGAMVFWSFPGGQFSSITTTFNDTGSAFPNTPQLFAARYGNPPLLGDGSGVRANFRIDAETVLGVMCTALSRASEDPNNPWGLRPGVASVLECHDWAATMEPNGWAGSTLRRLYAPGSLPGGTSQVVTPGQPRITEAASSAHGALSVKWVARAGHDSFLVRAGDVLVEVPGTMSGADLVLPDNVGGPVEVTVTATLGGRSGKASIARVVFVQPRPAPSTPPPVEPGAAVCLEAPGLPSNTRILIKVVTVDECN